MVWRFQTVAAVANAGTTGTVVLYNVTDSVVVATLTVTTTTPTIYSIILTVPGDLPSGGRYYESQFQMIAPNTGDKIMPSSMMLSIGPI
jgi:hypothetical protein